MKIKTTCYYLIFTTCITYSSTALSISQTTGIDEQAQLPYWELSDKNMSLRLVQRLPIQTRAYFLARGFTQPQAEAIAQSCVFQVIFKNNSHRTKPSPLEYDLNDWKILYKGEQRKLRTRENWAGYWQAHSAKKPAMVAFEWSLLPTRQQYQAGDYNWGMATLNIAPGSRTDLAVQWKQYDKTNRFTIKNLDCAADINPQSNENP